MSTADYAPQQQAEFASASVMVNGKPVPLATSPMSTEPLMEASGEHTADPLPPSDAALLQAMTHAQDRLSPPLPAGGRAMPLPAVQMTGTKGAATADRAAVDPVFDRRYTVERLLDHPDAGVRQRAQEAQVAIHHGAADIGIKVRAAIDVAKSKEAMR